MKIPTILGLLLLTIAISLGMYLYHLSQTKVKLLQTTLAPSDVRVVNLTPTSATITWQTDQLSTGQVIYGKGAVLNLSQIDDRDSPLAQPRLTHFATLKKLQPQTQYSYQIKSNQLTLATKPLIFTTLPSPAPMTEDFSLYQPLRGTVITSGDGQLVPIDEALVFLKVVGASPQATFTTAGNFILPIAQLYRLGSNQLVDLSLPIEAMLEIIRGDQKSGVEIILPIAKSLPAVTLGQNLDFKKLLSSPSAQASPPPKTSQFDLNSDGKINSLDLSIILQNFGKNPKEKRADLNSDGIVDLKDTELIKKALQ